jgi:hypothetical protein
MTKLVVHVGTGTIIPADECLVVTITDDLYPLDHEIVERAEEDGKPLNLTDLTYRNTVAFSPSALRSEAEEQLSNGYATDDDTIAYLTWTAEVATDDELNEVAGYILNDDGLWGEYNTTVMDGMRQGFAWSKEKK